MLDATPSAVRALIARLHGNYAVGPHLPNGDPEFGLRQFQSPPKEKEQEA